MRRTKVLITGFIGSPRCIQAKLDSAQERYFHTKGAIQKVRAAIKDREIYVALTGDADMVHKLSLEFDSTCHIQWFTQDESLSGFGKGRLEHELIRRALQFWRFDECGEKILKITAKYEIANLRKIISYVDEHDFPVIGWKIRGERMIDTRCFSFLASYYNKFGVDISLINDARLFYYEHYMYKCLKTTSGRYFPIGLSPLIYGVSGSENTYVKPSRLRKAAAAFLGWIYG